MTPFPPEVTATENPFSKTFGPKTFTMPVDKDEIINYTKMKKWFRRGAQNKITNTVPWPEDDVTRTLTLTQTQSKP